MLKSIALLALLLPVAAAAAPTAPFKQMERDGMRFEYSTQLNDRDTIGIKGRFLDNYEKFKLVVKPSGRVTGTMGDRPVDFSIARVDRDNLVAQLKSQQLAANSQ